MGSKPKNWQLLLEWLQAITGNEQLWNHDLRAVKDELTLYTRLKDGVVLARMIYVQGNKPVTNTEINYHTENVFILEEENIKLFLEVVETKFSIRKIFGNLGSTAFKEFADFPVVIKGLSRLSKELASRSRVPGFDLNEKIEKRRKGNDSMSSIRSQPIYSLDQELTYGDHFDLYDTYINAVISRTLDESVKELPTFHLSHSKNVLHFLDSFSSILCAEYPHNVLARHLLPSLRIRELIELHDQLDQEFNILELDYEALEDIFTKYSDRFLIYCYICSKQKYVQTTFSSKMRDNQSFKSEIEHTYNLMKEKRKSLRTPARLDDLFQMIQQVFMRFTLKLDDIAHHAYKAGRKRVQKSAASAGSIMKNVNQHIDAYVSDTNHMEMLSKLKTTLKLPNKRFPDGDMFLAGHHLTEIVENLELKNGREEKFKRCKIYIFEKMIIEMEIVQKVEIQQGVMAADKIYTEEEFNNIYCMNNFERPALLERLEKKVAQGVIQLESYTNGKVDLEKTVEIKCKIDEARNLHHKLCDLHKKNEQHKKENIKPGIDHKNHQFDIYAELIKESGEGELGDIHKRCAECKKFFYGKYQIGIFCFDHKDYFCFNCFQTVTKKDENDDIYYGDFPIVDLEMYDLRSDQLSRSQVENMLMKRRENTFILRTRSRDDKMCVSVKREKEVQHLIIDEQETNGKIWYYLVKGTASTDLKEMIDKSREVLHLHIPYRDHASKDILNSLRELGDSFKHCTFSELSEQEITRFLKKQSNGTFLFNSTSTGTYLVKRTRKDILQLRLLEDDFECIGFQDTDIKKDNLNDLLEYCQTLPANHQIYLASPLPKTEPVKFETFKTAVQAESATAARGINEKNLSHTEIPFITSTEAHKILFNSSSGDFVIRKNENGEVRITYKAGSSVRHFVLQAAGQGLFMTAKNRNALTLPAHINKLKANGTISNQVVLQQSRNVDDDDNEDYYESSVS